MWLEGDGLEEEGWSEERHACDQVECCTKQVATLLCCRTGLVLLPTQ